MDLFYENNSVPVEFTFVEEGAKEYKYSKSTKQRVYKWNDIKVRLYIYPLPIAGM